MANTYTWDIAQLQSYPFYKGQYNVVVAIHWILIGTDNINTVSQQGVIGLSLNPDIEFTPYQDLTKNKIISWVQESLGSDGVQEAINGIDNDLAQLASQPVFNPLPW
jgi:hypothetical protein